jgi:N-dimethylarginine dimethylaminohydrolase
MLSVYQHWDPLEVCAVGRSYPPEFYSFIENPKVRNVMERIAIETEEDYQKLIKILESFDVTVVRNDISDNFEDHMWMERYSPPPMCPRDHTIMLGNQFFMPGESYGLTHWQTLSDDYYVDLYDETCILKLKTSTVEEKERALISIREKIRNSPKHLQKDFINELKWNMRSINHDPLTTFPNNKKFDTFGTIREYVKSCGNEIITDQYVSGSCTTRVGKDLYHGTSLEGEDISNLAKNITNIHKRLTKKDYRGHIVPYNTHSDAVFVPVKEGLIISLFEPSFFEKTFPGWEVVSLPGQSWDKVGPFLELKEKNAGKWWVPGEELNDDFTDFVESWLKDWVLYVEETVFDVNMLIINPTNVIVNNYNEKVFDAFERHGITPHVLNFRHRYFWDGGLSCITSDLGRIGERKDYFPERSEEISGY